jgi:hypothetical protein
MPTQGDGAQLLSTTSTARTPKHGQRSVYAANGLQVKRRWRGAYWVVLALTAPSASGTSDTLLFKAYEGCIVLHLLAVPT